MIDHIPRENDLLRPAGVEGAGPLLSVYEEEINKLTAAVIRQEAELVETRVELNKRVRSLKFFQNLNKRILAAKTHREIYQVVVRSLVEIGFDKALIFKRRQSDYRVVAHHGYSTDILRHKLPAPGLLQLIEANGALLVNGENRDFVDCSYEDDLGVCFFIAASFTLRQGSERPHILLAGNTAETTVRRSRLTEVDLQILQTLAQQIGVAVENAFFYEQLEKSEKKFRSLYENSVEGLFQTSIDGRILSVNPAMARMLGYGSPRELIAAGNPADKQVMLMIDNFARFARIMTARGSVIGYEVELLGKGDARIWGSITARCVRSSTGEPRCFEGSIVDITDQKRARQLEIEKRAAEKASRTKGQFLANMSHEIRTPMNGVLGMTTLLMDTGLDATQQHYVQAIRQSSEALLTIINDILEFSKIQPGKISQDIVEFNLRSMLDDVVDLIETRIDQTRVQFICYAEPDVPAWVKGDPRRLRQVLINLAINAIKFTSRGNIRIRVCVEEDRGGCQLRFSVRDTGPGVPPEKQQALFESFTQLDNSFTREVEGTGLGLAISRQLVELMGGEIGVISTLGKGSEFWFTVGAEICPTTMYEEKETDAFRGVRLLVAETDEENRGYLCRQLKTWGAVVDEAKDDADYHSKLKGTTSGTVPYQLIISDGSFSDPAEMAGIVDAGCRRVILHNSSELSNMTVQPVGSDVVFLTRPIRYASLLKTCSCLLAGGDTQCCAAGITPQLWAYSSGRAKARVLVVEDHHINQQVVVGMLSRLGCVHIDAVANGLEAIQNVRRFPYDIVFMDVSMPVMDGLEATRRIRSLQQETGSRRLPVVALTAHAMVGDRERCLQAGMDEVVTKPVQPQALAAALDACLPSDSLEHTEYCGDSGIRLLQQSSGSAAPSVVFDLGILKSRLLGDELHARMIAEYFRNEIGGQIEEIDAAVCRGDLAESGRLVHRLKGSSGNVQAQVLFSLMSAMQDAAAAEDLDTLKALMREVRGHSPVLIQAITEQLEQ